MKVHLVATLAASMLIAPVAMAGSVSTGDAKQIVRDLLVKSGQDGEKVGTAERQGSYIVVHTLTNEAMPFRDLKVDPETGAVRGFPQTQTPMTGQRDAGTKG